MKEKLEQTVALIRQNKEGLLRLLNAKISKGEWGDVAKFAVELGALDFELNYAQYALTQATEQEKANNVVKTDSVS